MKTKWGAESQASFPPRPGDSLTLAAKYSSSIDDVDFTFPAGTEVLVTGSKPDGDCRTGLRIFVAVSSSAFYPPRGLDAAWFTEYNSESADYHKHLRVRTIQSGAPGVIIPKENTLDVPGTMKMNWELTKQNNLLRSTLENLHSEVLGDLGCNISTGRLAAALRITFDVLEMLKK